MEKAQTGHSRVLIPIVILAVISLLLLILTAYQLLGVSDWRVQQAAEQQLLDGNLQRLSVLRQTAARDEETRTAMEQFGIMLPKGVDQNGLFDRIADDSRKHNVVISAIAFSGAEEAVPGVQRLPLSVDLSGQYGDVMALLEDLVGDEQLAILDSVTMTRATDAVGHVTAQAKAFLYFR
ncbi:MAG: hypothetical protein RR135_02350 [Oscillospiraceae bacterium]